MALVKKTVTIEVEDPHSEDPKGNVAGCFVALGSDDAKWGPGKIMIKKSDQEVLRLPYNDLHQIFSFIIVKNKAWFTKMLAQEHQRYNGFDAGDMEKAAQEAQEASSAAV